VADIDKVLGIDQPAEDEEARQQDRLEGMRLCLYESDDLERIPEPVPLVEGWLDLDSLAWLYGERGHRKSFAAIDLSGCVAAGADWHGYPAKQATVLYAMCEGIAGLGRRVRAWEDYHQMKHQAVFLGARPPLHLIRDAPALGTLAAEMEAGLIVIDTQNRATVGLDENSNVDMGRMIAALDSIREQTRACLLLIHHAAVGSMRPRGHGSIDGAASVMIRVASDGNLVKIANEKQREEARSASLLLTARGHLGSAVLTSDGALPSTDSEARIRSCLRDLLVAKDNVTHSEIKRAATSTGMPESTFNWALRRQVEKGLIVRHHRSYALADPAQGQLVAVEDPDPPADD
jgi:hypothetical protein